MPVWSDVAEMTPYLERILESIIPPSAPIDQNRWENAVAKLLVRLMVMIVIQFKQHGFAATGIFWRTN